MHIPPELLPVLQITLPLLAGMFVLGWIQTKRLDAIIRHLEIIEALVARVEESLPPLIHR